MIAISIDVTLLDKTRFKKHERKNGKTAMFCELVLIETPNGEYGDYMVKESQTKEERESGKQLPILGNGKDIQRQSGGPSAKHSAPHEVTGPEDGDPTKSESDDVPF